VTVFERFCITYTGWFSSRNKSYDIREACWADYVKARNDLFGTPKLRWHLREVAEA
jgi:hypothetical protein